MSRCRADRCTRQRETRNDFCGACWQLVPQDIRNAIYLAKRQNCTIEHWADLLGQAKAFIVQSRRPQVYRVESSELRVESKMGVPNKYNELAYLAAKFLEAKREYWRRKTTANLTELDHRERDLSLVLARHQESVRANVSA